MRKDGHVTDPPHPAGTRIDAELRQLLISDAMAGLSPAHRQALTETYLSGRTVSQAAAVIGVPPEVLRPRVLYALRSFKLALEERGVAT